MTMITPSYLGETIEYSSLHACRSTLEDPTLLGALFPGGERWGYVFAAAPSRTAPGERFWATAVPVEPGPGRRWFFANHTGVVLAATAPFDVDLDACEPRAPLPPAAPEPVRASDPERAKAFATAGTDALYAGRWLAALEPLETSLELAPGNVETWNNLGKAYLELGTADARSPEGALPSNALSSNVLLARAEDSLRRGIVAARGKAPALAYCENNLGLVFLRRAADAARLPEVEEAREKALVALAHDASAHFAKALALDPEYEGARINAAGAWILEAEHSPPEARPALGDKALAALEPCEALKKETANTRIARRNLGLAHRAAGHPREAVRALAAVLDMGAASADEATAAALADEALALARSLPKPPAAEDDALVRHVVGLLRARSRAGVRGSSSEDAIADEIETVLGDPR